MSSLLQFVAQVGSRNRWKRHDVYGTSRAQANRQLSDGRVVGGFDGSDKIIRAEHRVLSNHFTAEVRDLLVHELEPVRMIKQCLTSFGRQSTQQNVRGHDWLSVRNLLLCRSIFQPGISIFALPFMLHVYTRWPAFARFLQSKSSSL